MIELVDISKAKKERDKKKRDERRKKNQPSDVCRSKGRDGDDFFLFSVTYAYKGKNFSFDLWAKNKRDAENRVEHIKRFPVQIEQPLDILPYNGGLPI